VFSQGDTGTKFYVILEGRVGVYLNLEDPATGLRAPTQVGMLSKGDAFGELALLHNKPRAATIRCLANCHFAVLEKNDYVKTIAKVHENKLTQKIDFLLSLPMFRSWTRGSMQKLSYYFKEKAYTRRQIVVKSGDSVSEVLIIREGEVEVRKEVTTKSLLAAFMSPKTSTTFVEMAILTTGETIGHEEMLNSTPHKYTYVCHSAVTKLLIISKEDFSKRINTEESWNVLRAMTEVKGDMRQKLLSNLELLDFFKQNQPISRPNSTNTNKRATHRLVKTPKPEPISCKSKENTPVRRRESREIEVLEAGARLYPYRSLRREADPQQKPDHNKTLRRLKSWDVLIARKTIDLKEKHVKTSSTRRIVNIHTYIQRVKSGLRGSESSSGRPTPSLRPCLTVNTLEMTKMREREEHLSGKRLDRVVSSSHSQFRFKRYGSAELVSPEL
jgi:CRP-like cAMP-binding protein